MKILEGKVAVITGSSRGLGLAIAKAYAQHGASVIITSRGQKAVNQAVDALRELDYRVDGIACDTSKLEQVEALADFAINRFEKLDIWVNNAGISAPYGPTIAVPIERFTTVIHTNILGVYYGSLVAMRRFHQQKSGKLINLLGRGAGKPIAFQNAYASSKAWVRSFSKALAEESKATGVGVYLFNPGLVLTDMITNVEAVEGYEKKLSALNTVIRMWGNPPDVPAQKALWLASPATDGKTGLEVSILTPRLLIGGALREMTRRLMRRPTTIPDIKVTQVQDESASLLDVE